MKTTKIYIVHLPEAQEMINDKNNEMNNTNHINLGAMLKTSLDVLWNPRGDWMLWWTKPDAMVDAMH